jgi:hypothetical protein
VAQTHAPGGNIQELPAQGLGQFPLKEQQRQEEQQQGRQHQRQGRQQQDKVMAVQEASAHLSCLMRCRLLSRLSGSALYPT